jgi:phytoene/squalene synthetase
LNTQFRLDNPVHLATAGRDRDSGKVDRVNPMSGSPAAAITRAASKQTFYTVRFLVDRDRVDDAYRAYAYFRWVDDVLDAETPSGSVPSDGEACERKVFLERQKSLLERCLRGEAPRDVNLQETMLVELVRHNGDQNRGLHAYLRNMMRVMEFDAGRRGRLISQVELDAYTRWLAIAVTEALHHFVGHGAFAPHGETRYLAVSAAHITHMLRDTYADARAGYYNVPREVLEAHHLGPEDVQSVAYRAWVQSRVRLARERFAAGRSYFARVENWRHRLAGFAYIARFAWLLDTIEREEFRLRPAYDERKSVRTGLGMGWRVLSSAISPRPAEAPSRPIASLRKGKV